MCRMHSIFFRYWGDALRLFRVRHPTREMPPPLARNSEKESVQHESIPPVSRNVAARASTPQAAHVRRGAEIAEPGPREGGRDNSRRCAMRGRRRDGDDGPGSTWELCAALRRGLCSARAEAVAAAEREGIDAASRLD